ncbi:DUF4395 domain-containing protein [Actinomadura atramentaria]|uniref:DUF4395 domain-containing protein n=1 Tax=Actinomadura atramentaria TaxID=1990 RepID=UPI00036E97C6|nr:DUF4395 domain-containing protein [Actinomadura atramentaria]
MQVDPRGQRFAAAVTSVVLIAVLVNGNPVLLAAQALVFALPTIFGLRFAPYGLVFRLLVRPRLGPPAETEDARPPRFAQGVGLVFALTGTVGYALGISWLGTLATALALGAAFLNAAFGFCLGCETYLLIRRITTKNHSNREVPA